MEDQQQQLVDTNELTSKEQISSSINWQQLHHFSSESTSTLLNQIVYYTTTFRASLTLSRRRNCDLSGIGGFFVPDLKYFELDDFYEASKFQSGRRYRDSASDSCLLVHEIQIHLQSLIDEFKLTRISSLNWSERQLVPEWNLRYAQLQKIRAALAEYQNGNQQGCRYSCATNGDSALDEIDYYLVKTLHPIPSDKGEFDKSTKCHKCQTPFYLTSTFENPVEDSSINGEGCSEEPFKRRRHHCRLCLNSFCGSCSSFKHHLPQLGYDPMVPERCCLQCKQHLLRIEEIERILWKMCRVRDCILANIVDGYPFVPYFEVGVDSTEDYFKRITNGALKAAKQIPLGAQTYVAVETIDILRKHGLKGIYGLLLRKEFLAAADLIRRVTGLDKAWPLSVHELTVAIFYALAQHKAVRGNDPEREHLIHSTISNRPLKTINDNETMTKMRKIISKATPPDKNMSENTFDEITDEYLNLITVSLATDDSGHNVSAEAKSSANDAIDESDEDSIANLLRLADQAIEENSHLVRNNKVVKDCDVGNKSCAFMNDSKGSIIMEKDEAIASPVFSEGVLKRQPVCEEIDDATISSLLFYAPLALSFIYMDNEVDIQLLAAQQGWQLLYANLAKDASALDRPASALLINHKQKVSCFVIRGTASLQDVVTDVRTMPIPFPEQEEKHDRNWEEDWTPVWKGNGLAFCGMARAATHFFKENLTVFKYLVSQGYRLRFTGHSLGGGVASLLALLVIQSFEMSSMMKSGETNDLVRAYGYGTPACIDEKLSAHLEKVVTTVILHDDVVPRLTPTSIRRLIKHLLFIRETWVKEHLSDDLSAVANRVKTAWGPRWRNSTLRSTYFEEEDRQSEEHNSKSSSETIPKIKTEKECAEFNPLTDMSIGLKVDGDMYYEAEEDLIESDDDSGGFFLEKEGEGEGASEGISGALKWGCKRISSLNKKAPPRRFICKEEAVPFDEPKDENNDSDDAFMEEDVFIEEIPLPRMFIPGKLVHIYVHRGGYKAVYVPRDFKDIRRVSLAGNMLSDHTSKSYYEALLEVISVRQAKFCLPRWEGFAERARCACCSSHFTWASTSDSLAQEVRDKHNCRACGRLVCDPCSQNRIPLPKMGLDCSQFRVCDSCYYQDMGARTNGEMLARSFLLDNDV